MLRVTSLTHLLLLQTLITLQTIEHLGFVRSSERALKSPFQTHW